MTEQMRLIAERIRNTREILDLSVEQIAATAGLTVEEYLRYETATVDFSFSVLHKIAKALNMDMTDLLSGESARLSCYVLTRAGKGHSIKRNNAYDYKHLAISFKNKMIEPFFVTLQPDEPGALHLANTHSGQEFDYVVEGTLRVVLNDQELVLNVGDSILYDSSYPHAMYALGDQPAKFIAVVTE